MKFALVVSIALVACGGDSVVEIGIIDYSGESDGILEAPASTILGGATKVRVNTYGGGCVSAEWLSVDYSSDIEVELTPYDRRLEGICTLELRRPSHEEDLVLSRRGTVTLRVVGRRVDQQTDELTEVRRRIEVE